MSILRKQLEQALLECSPVTIKASGEIWYGRPTYLDDEWVEILCISTDKHEGEVKAQSQTWLIKLDRISAIAKPSEIWNSKRFNEIQSTEKGLPLD